MGMDSGMKFGVTRTGKQNLTDPQGYIYVKRSERKEHGKVIIQYWSCTRHRPPHRCGGIGHFFPGSGEWKMTQSHSCDLAELEKPKAVKRANERLKELTLAAEEGTRPVDIVNKMLEEVSPEIWDALPSEKALRERVRKYARVGGVTLGPNTFVDEDDDGGEDSSSNANPAVTSGGGAVKNKAILEFRLRKMTPTLSLVDEEGRDLSVPVDMIVTAGEEQPQPALNLDCLPKQGSSRSIPASPDEDEGTAPDDSNDFEDDAPDEDDFINPMDFDDGRSEVKPSAMKKSPSKAKTVSTSSKVKSATGRLLKVKEALKSGEKCFVCGDDILVSEASSSSQETFRKACCYLNVKSEHEWFPRKSNGQFYSFCELCTKEITRIQELYRNVEEKQSLIFKKVAQLEKLIADSEILDNSLVEGPVSSARRLEGFRKQVIINYKNKLKLRREIRMGTKLGQDFSEIQPITSAHMFATDPAESHAYRKVFITTDESKNVPPLDKRTRGRPKSTKKSEDQKPDPVYGDFMNENGDIHAFDDNDDASHNMAADDDDAMSVASERERKFWEDDPTKLMKLHNKHSANEDEDDWEERDNADLEVGDDYEDGADPQSDSDYQEDNDDDDADWREKSKIKEKHSTTTAAGRKTERPSTTKTATSSSSRIDRERSAKRRKSMKTTKPKPPPPTSKPRRKFHHANIQFPDVVLTKEGRMFLSGIEIIKNPPGMYKPRPSELSFSCGACSRISPTFHSAKSHVAGHHLSLYKCEICGKTVSNGRSLQRHKKTNHPTGGPRTRTPCHICGRPILTDDGEQRNMQFHIWHHLSPEEKKDPKYSGYAPLYKRDPNRKKKNTGLSELQCQHCPKRYFRMDALQAHEKTHTDADDGDGASSTGFQCQFCGKLYKRKLTRETTRTCGKAPSVESQLRYPCPVCEVSLKSPPLRRRHMRKFHGSNPTSSSSQPFGCPKCPRRFQTRKAFQSHKRVCVEINQSKMGGGGGSSNPQEWRRDMEESSNSKCSTSEGNQLKSEAVGGSGDQYQYECALTNSSGGGSGGTENLSNNPIQMPSSSSSAALLSGCNLFGNYPPAAGNRFQSHHHPQ